MWRILPLFFSILIVVPIRGHATANFTADHPTRSPAAAAADEELYEESEDEPQSPSWSIENRVLGASKFISHGLDKAAETIDITLAGKKYTQKPNDSSIKINQFLTYLEGGKITKSTDFGLNLRLPNLEKRWQLRFSSYDEEQDNRDLSQQRVRTQARPRDYGASIFFFRKLGNIKTSFMPRLLLKNPLEMSYVLRFESSAESKPFRMVPRVDLFADPNKGTGEFTSLEFQYKLNKHSDLAQQNTEEYQSHGNYLITQHGIAYDYSLTDDKAVGGSVTGVSTNRPKMHLDSLVLATVYTEQIYKRVFRYALTPFLSFAKGDHFKGKAGITLTLELDF